MISNPNESSNIIQFYAVNCVHEEDACNYVELCSNKRTVVVKSSYTMHDCGYPTIISYQFNKGK